MADQTISVGRPSFLKRLVEITTGVFADAVIVTPVAVEAELVVAGAASVLGKIGTVPAAAQLLVRCDCSDKPYSAIDWRVKCDKAHALAFYRAHGIVNAVTVTVASLANTETGIINALTFTAVDAAASVDYTAHNFYTGGADATADAASLRKAINGGTKITLSGVAAGEIVVVNGVSYTAHATTTTAANHEFAINGTDAQDATALASCINDGTYGSGLTLPCEANGAVITFEGTTACTGSAGATVAEWTGVPGVTATSALGVVSLVATTATVIQAVTGTAAGHWAVATTTLTLLAPDPELPSIPGLSAGTTTAGPLRRQWIDGYPQAYIGITNNDGSNGATVVVGRTRIP